MFKKALEMKLSEKGITRNELAEKLGITPQQLSMKLNCDNISEKTMLQIADALELKLEIALK